MPVISLTGPRQSGKTTLVEELFPNYKYANLENPGDRQYALEDPLAFLQGNDPGLIIDEPQHVPELFSYIQVLVDQKKQNGQFILTGSQNFLMLEKIGQSLAGRVAVFHLLPFSLPELDPTPYRMNQVDEYLFRGFYPRVYDQKVPESVFYPSYTMTYLERDVRSVLNIRNLNTFQKFIVLLASRIGQLLNFSNLSNELGVSVPTVQEWFSILEASFIAFRLKPFFKNYGKRVIKTPKVYFYDPGLVCSLLAIRSVEELENHFLRGALFENLVVLEALKSGYNQGINPDLYFWRDRSGNEVDLLVAKGLRYHATEIKSGKTLQSAFFKGLKKLQALAGEDIIQSWLVYGGDESQTRNAINVRSWQELPDLNA